jgi:hypothetical protein
MQSEGGCRPGVQGVWLRHCSCRSLTYPPYLSAPPRRGAASLRRVLRSCPRAASRRPQRWSIPGWCSCCVVSVRATITIAHSRPPRVSRNSAGVTVAGGRGQQHRGAGGVQAEAGLALPCKQGRAGPSRRQPARRRAGFRRVRCRPAPLVAGVGGSTATHRARQSRLGVGLWGVGHRSVAAVSASSLPPPPFPAPAVVVITVVIVG